MGAAMAELVGDVILLAAFVAWPRSRDPERAFVNVALVRYRSVGSGALGIFVAGSLLYAAQFLLPLFWQDTLGVDALTAALILLPQGIGALLSRSLAGRLTDSRGGRFVATISLAAAVATTLLFSVLDPHMTGVLPEALIFVHGLAIGMLIVPISTMACASVPDEHVPDAAVIVRMCQQMGGSLGTAVTATVLAALTTAGVPLPAAFHQTFHVLTAAAVVGLLATLAMPRRRRTPQDRVA